VSPSHCGSRHHQHKQGNLHPCGKCHHRQPHCGSHHCHKVTSTLLVSINIAKLVVDLIIGSMNKVTSILLIRVTIANLTVVLVNVNMCPVVFSVVIYGRYPHRNSHHKRLLTAIASIKEAH
jgi:hypothetical protein